MQLRERLDSGKQNACSRYQGFGELSACTWAPAAAGHVVLLLSLHRVGSSLPHRELAAHSVEGSKGRESIRIQLGEHWGALRGQDFHLNSSFQLGKSKLRNALKVISTHTLQSIILRLQIQVLPSVDPLEQFCWLKTLAWWGSCLPWYHHISRATGTSCYWSFPLASVCEMETKHLCSPRYFGHSGGR